MTLSLLHDGFDVPEYDLRIPWLINESQLFHYLPRDDFEFSPAGWPGLRFTLLGVTELFWFNFVTHPERRLVEVRYQNGDPETQRRTAEDFAASFRRTLGRPWYEFPHHIRWQDERLFVESKISPEYAVAGKRNGYPVLKKLKITTHVASVFFRSGIPKRSRAEPA